MCCASVSLFTLLHLIDDVAVKAGRLPGPLLPLVRRCIHGKTPVAVVVRLQSTEMASWLMSEMRAAIHHGKPANQGKDVYVRLMPQTNICNHARMTALLTTPKKQGTMPQAPTVRSQAQPTMLAPRKQTVPRYSTTAHLPRKRVPAVQPLAPLGVKRKLVSGASGQRPGRQLDGPGVAHAVQRHRVALKPCGKHSV